MEEPRNALAVIAIVGACAIVALAQRAGRDATWLAWWRVLLRYVVVLCD